MVRSTVVAVPYTPVPAVPKLIDGAAALPAVAVITPVAVTASTSRLPATSSPSVSTVTTFTPLTAVAISFAALRYRPVVESPSVTDGAPTVPAAAVTTPVAVTSTPAMSPSVLTVMPLMSSVSPLIAPTTSRPVARNVATLDSLTLTATSFAALRYKPVVVSPNVNDGVASAPAAASSVTPAIGVVAYTACSGAHSPGAIHR